MPVVHSQGLAVMKNSLMDVISNKKGYDVILGLEAIEAALNNRNSDLAGTMNTKHYFSGDMFARETLFRKGMAAIGATHKYDHLSIMVSGHMTIWTPEKGLHDVHGPSVTTVKKGMKRAGFAHEDTLWVCVFNTHDIDMTETSDPFDVLTFEKYEQYLTYLNSTFLENNHGDRSSSAVRSVGSLPANIGAESSR